MDMVIKGRHMVVTDAIREYAHDKIGRNARIIDGDHVRAEVELYVEKNPSIGKNHVAEVTVWTKGPVIRAKEAASDMYAAIDLVSEKLERQFRKYKGKVLDRHLGKRAASTQLAPVESDTYEEAQPSIVKTKVLNVKPMMPEEAILQLELLGHDFFVFTSAETEAVNVLYRRKDGDYGLIEPRVS